jgi:hypothetical protein
MWHAFAATSGLIPPSIRPNHLAAPSRRRAPLDVPPLAKFLGSQTDLLTPMYDGRAEIISFRYLPVKRLWPVPPHPPRVARSRSRGLASFRGVAAPVAPHCPLHTPSGWHARRAGVWHHCRRVVASVAPVPNCPIQESTCASLQCSCKSLSLEPPGE